MSKNPMAGLPDILGFLNTRHAMFCIEVKTKTGKLSDKQKIWQEKLERAGCIYIVATEVLDVMKMLDEHENS